MENTDSLPDEWTVLRQWLPDDLGKLFAPPQLAGSGLTAAGVIPIDLEISEEC